MTIRKHYIATTDSGLVGARTPERRSTGSDRASSSCSCVARLVGDCSVRPGFAKSV